MPMDRRLYPKNWEAIALEVKRQAGWDCEQCHRPCRRPGESVAELIERIDSIQPKWDLWEEEETEEFGLVEVPKVGRFVLTVAHLNHEPADCRRENLKALCSVCHLRYDARQIRTKRRLKQERRGQLTIPLGGGDTA